MCGERACVDKKEFKQYFAENLIVEIQIVKDKRKTSVDLVKLNTSNSIDKNIIKEQKFTQKLNTREQKYLIKAEKKRILLAKKH